MVCCVCFGLLIVPCLSPSDVFPLKYVLFLHLCRFHGFECCDEYFDLGTICIWNREGWLADCPLLWLGGCSSTGWSTSCWGRGPALPSLSFAGLGAQSLRFRVVTGLKELLRNKASGSLPEIKSPYRTILLRGHLNPQSGQ